MAETEPNPIQRTTNEPIALRLTPRCGAKTRSGSSCQSPRVSGKRRCRMHGGARGSGAPRGERHGAYRHGLYTCEVIEERRAVRAILRQARAVREHFNRNGTRAREGCGR
jgi:hypothetical protein